MLAPEKANALLTSSAPGLDATRGFGSALIAIGLTTWATQDVRDAETAKNIGRAMLTYHVLAFLLNLNSKLHKDDVGKTVTVAIHAYLSYRFYQFAYGKAKADKK